MDPIFIKINETKKRAQRNSTPHTCVQRQVTLTNRQDFNDLAAMLRGMRDMDPAAYARVSSPRA